LKRITAEWIARIEKRYFRRRGRGGRGILRDYGVTFPVLDEVDLDGPNGGHFGTT
jgi:hypothetical protein